VLGLWLLLGAGGASLLVMGAVPAVAGGRAPEALALITPLPSASLPPLPTPTLPKPSLPAVTPPALPKVTPLPTVTAVPLPTITPLPTILPTPLPSPTLPVLVSPNPSLPPIGATPMPSSSPVSGSGGGPGQGTATGGSGGTGGGSGGGIPITLPIFGTITVSTFDIALLGAFGALPLLFGIWMLLFGRTWTQARRSRDAQIRLAIAHDIGLSPRELESVSTRSLFKLREEAAFDELTGVLRRAAGISALDREVSRARRQKSPLSVAFIDVDGLKQANDKQGHKAGDDLLRGLASILKSGLRGQDLVVRYGGDEFVCVLPDTVGDAARAKMSWIQTEAEKSGIKFSAGIAELTRSDDVVSLLGRADTEMYAVKSRRGVVRDLRLGVVGDGRRVPA
jgi:diguanylate cyclase (GGDEF)-like protein